MKISDIKGDDALDVIAEIIDPAIEIMGDNEIAICLKTNQTLKAVKFAIKKHKKAVKTILAVLDMKDPETYSPSVVTLPIKLLEVFNDPEIQSLFISQAQTEEAQSSGLVTENIEETGEK